MAERPWLITHVPLVRRLSAGGRHRGVNVVDRTFTVTMPPDLEAATPTPTPDTVRLRSYAAVGTDRSLAPLVIVYPDTASLAQLGPRSGEWLSSSLAARLPVVAVTVQVGAAVIDDREAGYQAFQSCTALAGGVDGPGHPKIAVLGIGTGGALAARVAQRSRDARDPENPRDPSDPPILRQALISPDIDLLFGPPSTTDALRTAVVARLSELPATLVQQYTPAERPQPGEDLSALLREAGVAVRAIDYPPSALSWADYPRAVRSSGRALDDLVAFLDRGIVVDGFEAVPAWNLH